MAALEHMVKLSVDNRQLGTPVLSCHVSMWEDTKYLQTLDSFFLCHSDSLETILLNIMFHCWMKRSKSIWGLCSDKSFHPQYEEWQNCVWRSPKAFGSTPRTWQWWCRHNLTVNEAIFLLQDLFVCDTCASKHMWMQQATVGRMSPLFSNKQIRQKPKTQI